jgi:glycosyltransferase involved in cell wall biosynthesis
MIGPVTWGRWIAEDATTRSSGTAAAIGRYRLKGGDGYLRIGLVGGVFDRSETYRSAVRWTPETVLVKGLRERGHHVESVGHSQRFSSARFDVVHVHHLSWGALRAATDRSRTPFVFTLHASAPEHPAAASFVMGRADGVVALWPQEAEKLEQTYRLDGAEVPVIPNGIDATVFAFRQPQPPGEQPWRLLFVGQLIPAKGVDRLLQAVADLRRDHDVRLDLSYHVAIQEEALRTRTRELGLDDIVRFLGPARQDELAERYRSSHIVVLPTFHAEALPSVLTEAMLSGSYPVSTDVGGIRDQIGGFGVVIPRATPSDIAHGIERAIDTYGEHCARASRMRQSAERRFSIDVMVSSHEALYRSLCTAHRTPRRLRAGARMGTSLGRPILELWTDIRRVRHTESGRGGQIRRSETDGTQ